MASPAAAARLTRTTAAGAGAALTGAASASFVHWPLRRTSRTAVPPFITSSSFFASAEPTVVGAQVMEISLDDEGASSTETADAQRVARLEAALELNPLRFIPRRCARGRCALTTRARRDLAELDGRRRRSRAQLEDRAVVVASHGRRRRSRPRLRRARRAQGLGRRAEAKHEGEPRPSDSGRAGIASESSWIATGSRVAIV